MSKNDLAKGISAAGYISDPTGPFAGLQLFVMLGGADDYNLSNDSIQAPEWSKNGLKDLVLRHKDKFGIRDEKYKISINSPISHDDKSIRKSDAFPEGLKYGDGADARFIVQLLESRSHEAVDKIYYSQARNIRTLCDEIKSISDKLKNKKNKKSEVKELLINQLEKYSELAEIIFQLTECNEMKTDKITVTKPIIKGADFEYDNHGYDSSPEELKAEYASKAPTLLTNYLATSAKTVAEDLKRIKATEKYNVADVCTKLAIFYEAQENLRKIMYQNEALINAM
jgi:hypothetical protein